MGFLLLAVTIVLFSTFEVTGKVLGRTMGPLQITLSRFVIGGLVLLPFALLRARSKKVHLSPRDLGKIALLGVVNIVVSMGLIQLGLVFVNASVTAVLFSINPLFVAFFAHGILGEKMGPGQVWGLVLGLVGVAALFLEHLTVGPSTLWGLVLILGSAVTFALYTVLGKRFIGQRLDSVLVTSLSFLIGSLGLVPLFWGLGVPLVPEVHGAWPELLYMSVFVTGLAYVLYFEGLSRLDASAGSLLYFAKPALASLLAVVWLGETLGPGLIVGTLVIAAGIGVAVAGRPGRRNGSLVR